MNNNNNNFNFQTSPQGFGNYGYFPPPHNPNFFNFYHSQPFNMMSRSFYPSYQTPGLNQREPGVIKIQQESHSNHHYSKNKKLGKEKSTKSRKSLPRISEANKNIYIHPLKQAKHKVKYFDPNAAPVVTSSAYNLVQNAEKENERQRLIYSQNTDDVNQLHFPEQDEDIFIVYRYRRIKKKFKKYIKPKNFNLLTHQQDGSDNNSDNSSDSSQISSNNEQQPKQSDQANNNLNKEFNKNVDKNKIDVHQQQINNSNKSKDQIAKL